MKQKVRVAIGLGSNLGDRLAVLARAATALSGEFLEHAHSSSIYETMPWGVVDQPRFLNAVIVGESEWKPPAIVNYLKILEAELGRAPSMRFGPRLIDLDLLAYGELSWDSEGVTVPHPGLPEREFVLLPFCELWKDWKHPRLHQTAEELLTELSKTQPLAAKLTAPPLLSTASR